MMQPGVKIDDRELQTVLGGVIARCEDKRKGLTVIGAIARNSVRTNFAQGGRPTKWKPSKRATRDGLPGRSAATLRDTNRLMNSITSEVGTNSVVVGTDVEYAAVQNYGAVKGSFGTFVAQVKEHQRSHKSGKKYTVGPHSRRVALPWGTIPAREFMVLPQEDIEDIQAEFANFIGG